MHDEDEASEVIKLNTYGYIVLHYKNSRLHMKLLMCMNSRAEINLMKNKWYLGMNLTSPLYYLLISHFWVHINRGSIISCQVINQAV
jgi:hypothetical protein